MADYQLVKDTFVAFIDLTSENKFQLQREYDVEIVRAEVVGQWIHLLVKVSDNQQFVGFVCEKYDFVTEEFKRFVFNTHLMGCGFVVAVSTLQIEDIAGQAQLQEVDGHVVVDWSTFIPEVTPYNELDKFYRGA